MADNVTITVAIADADLPCPALHDGWPVGGLQLDDNYAGTLRDW